MTKRFAAKRLALKAILADPTTSEEGFYVAQAKLAKLPRNSSSVRVTNRCAATGRSRAVIRKFGLSRLTFREMAVEGKVPGVIKASW